MNWMDASSTWTAGWSLLCRGPMRWQDMPHLAWLMAGAPLLEEWVLRAGLHEALLRRAGSRRARWAAVGAVAAVFCLLHLGRGLTTALLVMPVALALGALYDTTRRWHWCAAAHAAGNALLWSACQS